MIDRIDALEEKIAALVDKINEAKARISDLQRQNKELYSIAEQKKYVDQENGRHQSRIKELEAELNARDDKESTVKDRLKMILNRIDTLEAEILELDTNSDE
jgi:predicted RNase H-like nuclease (RuvC/YqgF family)